MNPSENMMLTVLKTKSMRKKQKYYYLITSGLLTIMRGELTIGQGHGGQILLRRLDICACLLVVNPCFQIHSLEKLM
jgi:hypothetical protein